MEEERQYAVFWIARSGAHTAGSAILVVERDLKGSCKGDIDLDMDVEVDVDVERCFVCLKGFSKSVQVLLHGIDAVLVLTLRLLKQRARHNQIRLSGPTPGKQDLPGLNL